MTGFAGNKKNIFGRRLAGQRARQYEHPQAKDGFHRGGMLSSTPNGVKAGLRDARVTATVF
jgi:hypothetical protein